VAEVIVIQFPGVNCEYETVRVLETVGLSARVVRWNVDAPVLTSAAAIILPGGFSYQDRIRAGVVAAKDRVADSILEAVEKGVPVMGICNGAQILVETGAVPGFDAGSIDLALAPNRMPDRSGYFCTWIRVKKGRARCVFTEFMENMSDDNGTLPIPTAHAEGRFVTGSEETTGRLRDGEGVALVYASSNGQPADTFPQNPNDSLLSIAGVTNPEGNVLALMPHPERASWLHQVPGGIGGVWSRRRLDTAGDGLFSAGPGRGFFEALKKALAQ